MFLQSRQPSAHLAQYAPEPHLCTYRKLSPSEDRMHPAVRVVEDHSNGARGRHEAECECFCGLCPLIPTKGAHVCSTRPHWALSIGCFLCLVQRVSVASAAPQPARGRITGRRDSKKAACPLLQVPSILQELLSHVIALDEIAYLALLDIRRSRSTSSFS